MVSVNMVPLHGSNWEALKYACNTGDCGFKVDQDGISGVRTLFV